MKNIYTINKIEKVENGYVVEYYLGGNKTCVFKTIEEVLDYIKKYFDGG